MYKLNFANRYAGNLGNAFGIHEARQNELGQALDKMVKELSPQSGMQMVYAPDIIDYIQTHIAKTNEEFIYCLFNHIQWLAKTGRLIPAF